jgi:hypothetical protein
MEQSVEKIIERNLLEVFNGRHADSRPAAIDELWDKDGVVIDPGGVHEGFEKINATVELLLPLPPYLAFHLAPLPRRESRASLAVTTHSVSSCPPIPA